MKALELTEEQIATINAALDAMPETEATKDAQRAMHYTRDPIEAADAIKRREYFAAVSSIADECKAEIASGNLNDEEAVREWIEQSVDGSHWVIYAYANMDVLRYSENDSAFVGDFGGGGLVKDGNVNWAALAYSAMLADVTEEVGDVSDLLAEREDAEEDGEGEEEEDVEDAEVL